MARQLSLFFGDPPKDFHILIAGKGAPIVRDGKTMRTYSFLGYVDLASDRLVAKEGTLILSQESRATTLAFRPGAICRIRAVERIAFTTLSPETQLRFITLIDDNIYDPQLQHLWDTLQEDQILKDSLLGRLSFASHRGVFFGDITWQGHHALLRLQASPVHPAQVQRAKTLARKLFQSQETLQPLLYQATYQYCQSILSHALKRTITPTSLQEHFRVTKIVVWPKGTYAIYLDDTRLRLPMTIRITGSQKSNRLFARVLSYQKA